MSLRNLAITRATLLRPSARWWCCWYPMMILQTGPPLQLQQLLVVLSRAFNCWLSPATCPVLSCLPSESCCRSWCEERRRAGRISVRGCRRTSAACWRSPQWTVTDAARISTFNYSTSPDGMRPTPAERQPSVPLFYVLSLVVALASCFPASRLPVSLSFIRTLIPCHCHSDAFSSHAAVFVTFSLTPCPGLSILSYKDCPSSPTVSVQQLICNKQLS